MTLPLTVVCLYLYALYACPYKIHSSQFVKYDRNRKVPEVFSVPFRFFFFRFLLLRRRWLPFDCFAFIWLFVRNRKGRERKVSYLVAI